MFASFSLETDNRVVPAKQVVPVTNDRLLIHSHIKETLDLFLSTNKIPHIIFHGPSGTGKLSLVKEFLSKIYKGDKGSLKSYVMTVNCSHGKGIQFIRDELKFFAKTNIQNKSGAYFKSIVLLNAHHLTVDAQSALRRCIELFSSNTRFFIVVENKSKLLNPILSRFCDIYVPEPVVNGESINLHQYQLDRVFPFEQDMLEKVESVLGDAVFTAAEKMEAVTRLYEMGVSCLDMIRWIETKKDRWSELEYTDRIMRFHQVKSQFRNEKLLMLYMLYG